MEKMMKKTTKKVMSIDAETNGLWGQAFAIAAIAYNEEGNEVSRFVGRCPIEEDVSPWVMENVLPQMVAISETTATYAELLSQFFQWRNRLKADGYGELAHMGVPVEARLYMDAHSMGLFGDFDGPYPLIDPSAIPEIGTSVDTYNKENGIEVSETEYAGGTHNPLYDCAAAYKAYRHWLLNS